MQLLIVEDDPMLGRGMKRALESAGYGVDWVVSGEEATAGLACQEYALVLLDLSLRGMGGIEALKAVRGGRDMTPVIIVTARGEPDQKIAGLDAGADDYIVKPFDLDELLARIRAQIRRSENRANDVLEAQDVRLDLSARVVSQAGKTVAMTARELRALSVLMRRAGGFVSKDELERALYDSDGGTESNTIETAIYGLRKKLGGQFIITARGLGYMTPK